MQIINPDGEDYHIHSLNFSDGISTIEEIVQYAGKIGLKKIAITDHSQVMLDHYKFARKSPRSIIKRWENVHNDVKVIFGIEGDILNEQGDICKEIQNINSDFLILSVHDTIYQGDPKKINAAYLNAIKRYCQEIKFIGHPCAKYFAEQVDISALVRAANEYKIPLEFNCKNYLKGDTNIPNLQILLNEANQIYVNSDAHLLNELRDVRKRGFEYLRKEGYLKN